MNPRAKRAIDRLLYLEGGYVNNPKDPGGATKYGVSLRYLMRLGEIDPDDGFLYGDMNRDGKIDIEDIKAMTPDEAAKIYYHEWWLELGYDRIVSDKIAFRLLDQAVVSGPHPAAKVIQRAVNETHGGVLLAVDGKLGPLSIQAINEMCETPVQEYKLEVAHISQALAFFRSLHKCYFMAGWQQRVNYPV